MKIWVNGKWYDHKKTMIAIFLTDQDKQNLNDMHPKCNIYAQYDEKYISDDEVMKILNKLKKEVE